MAKGISDKVQTIRRNELLERERKRRQEKINKMTDEEKQKGEIEIIKGRILNLKHDLLSIDSDIIKYKLKLMEEQLVKEELKLKEIQKNV